MTDSITCSLATFKAYVARIEFDAHLDERLGEADCLLYACRCEIDKVWATSRNQAKPGVRMRITEGGNRLLEGLGLVKKVTVERRF